MSIPTITVPTYELKLPSNDTVIKYRPFLVKEEKILHIANETEDTGNRERSISLALKQVIGNCILTEGIDVESLPMFDIEYMILQIRSKSVGEVATPIIQCDKCKANFPKEVDLSTIKIKRTKNHTNKIQLSDDIGVVMKYPTINSVLESDLSDLVSIALDMVIDSIDYIYDKSDQVYKASDHTKEELMSFVESLTNDQFEKINTFFETSPKIYKTLNYTCPECGDKGKVVIDNVESFFG
jgi:hypothetical protein